MADCCERGQYSDFSGWNFCPFCAAPVKPHKIVITMPQAAVEILHYRGPNEDVPRLLRATADAAEKALNTPGFIRPAREWMATKGAE